MHIASADAEKRRDVAAQIEQRMQLDGGLGGAKMRPGKQGRTEIGGGRVQGIERVVESEADGFLDVEWASDGDQQLREVSEDAPVVGFIGVGQRGARDLAAQAEVIELAARRAQASLDVAQALVVGQLREGQGQKLVPTGKPRSLLSPS